MAMRALSRHHKVAYKLARQCYENERTLEDAEAELINQYGFTDLDAYTGITFLEKMLNGEEFTISISTKTMEYYIKNIFEDYGRVKLQKALLTVEHYIRAYEEYKYPNKKTGIRKIHNELSKKIQISPIFQDKEPYDWIDLPPDMFKEEVSNFIRKGFRMVSYSAKISKNVKGPCAVYLLRYGKKNVWKVGISQDVEARLGQINAHVPYEVINEKWALVDKTKYKNVDIAFDIEQRTLELLAEKRKSLVGERVICSKTEVQKAWKQAEKEVLK